MINDCSSKPLLRKKHRIHVSQEELAERCSTGESNKEQLYNINSKETLHRDPAFLEFLLKRPAPFTYSQFIQDSITTKMKGFGITFPSCKTVSGRCCNQFLMDSIASPPTNV